MDFNHNTTSNLLGALLVIALFQKFITIFVNQAIISFSDTETLGFANVQLELLLSTVLFLSREAFRLTFLGYSGKIPKVKFMSKYFLISSIPSLICATLSILACYKWSDILASQEQVNLRRRSAEITSIILFCIGGFFECLSEPWFNYYQSHGIVNIRVRAEIVSAISKALVTCWLILALDSDSRPLSFGIGQVCFGLSTLLVYTCSSTETQSDIAPAEISMKHVLSKSCQFSLQSVVKHFSTESDRILLVMNSSKFDQVSLYSIVFTHLGILL